MQKEIWKDIYDTNSYYQVSTFGNVRSVDRIIDNGGRPTNIRGRMIKQQLTHDGYPVIKIMGKTLRVHRLVAITFITNKENKDQVNHKDLNKINNNVSNLEWCNNRENVTHSKLLQKSTSKYVGVYYLEKYGKWNSQISIEGTTYSLGYKSSELDAHLAYQRALEDWNIRSIKPSKREWKGFYKKTIDGIIVKFYENLYDVKNDGYTTTSVSMSLNGNYPHNNNKYKGYVWEFKK